MKKLDNLFIFIGIFHEIILEKIIIKIYIEYKIFFSKVITI